MTENIKETGLERRSILKAAAWATPVVAVAATAPLAAASDGVVTWGDPSENGADGTLSFNNGTNALVGHQEAYYGVEVTGTGTAPVPPLTAVFTASGAWLGDTTFSSASGGPALAVGDNLPARGNPGFIWRVASISGNSVTLVSVTTSIPVGAIDMRTPRIWSAGTGDVATGGEAHTGVSLSGGAGVVGNTSSANVVVP